MSQPLKVFMIATEAACVSLQHRTSCWYDMVVTNNCEQPDGRSLVQREIKQTEQNKKFNILFTRHCSVQQKMP